MEGSGGDAEDAATHTAVEAQRPSAAAGSKHLTVSPEAPSPGPSDAEARAGTSPVAPRDADEAAPAEPRAAADGVDAPAAGLGGTGDEAEGASPPPARAAADESDAPLGTSRAGAEEADDPFPAPRTADDAPKAPPAEAPADPALFAHALRIAEALVFASDRPVTPARLQGALPPGCDARAVLTALAAACAGRPVQLVEVAGGFAFRTALELAPAITRVVEVPRRLPRAAMETLAIIAYHQPVTRAEIEEIRGASLSQSTLEMLLDAALIAPRGRKEVPGRPSLWGTTPRFLEQFGLKALNDLPRREELVNEPTLPLSAPPQPPADAPPPPAEA